MIDKLSIYQKMMAEIEEIQKEFSDAEICIPKAFNLLEGFVVQATGEKVIGNDQEATRYLQNAVVILCLLKQIHSPDEGIKERVSEEAKGYTLFENW